MLAFKDFFEPSDGVRHWHLLALPAGKSLGHTERLAQETLDLARAEDGEFVFGGELIHAQDSNNVLKVFIALEHALHPTGNIVMFQTDNFRGEGARSRGERIYSRVNTQFGN